MFCPIVRGCREKGWISTDSGLGEARSKRWRCVLRLSRWDLCIPTSVDCGNTGGKHRGEPTNDSLSWTCKLLMVRTCFSMRHDSPATGRPFSPRRRRRDVPRIGRHRSLACRTLPGDHRTRARYGDRTVEGVK